MSRDEWQAHIERRVVTHLSCEGLLPSKSPDEACAPELRLWLAVLGTAALDASKRRTGALSWWWSDDYKEVCSLIGVDWKMLRGWLLPDGEPHRVRCRYFKRLTDSR